MKQTSCGNGSHQRHFSATGPALRCEFTPREMRLTRIGRRVRLGRSDDHRQPRCRRHHHFHPLQRRNPPPGHRTQPAGRWIDDAFPPHLPGGGRRGAVSLLLCCHACSSHHVSQTSVFAAAGAALISATPALAQDNNTQQFTEGGIQAANNHNFATCICPVPLTGGQQIAVVPALGNYKTNRPNRDTVSIDGSAVDRVVGN
ncbi:hypothetical protein ACFWMR_10320 [Amycolatopsis thailandensis]|uniref:hypothetical protein n=1 Tax=Amycolatopsis thailandensis TaxID=589330 RepID=UPI00364D9CFC